MYSLDMFNTDYNILDLTKFEIYDKIIKIKNYEEEIELKLLDNISKKYYGVVELWWVIALYNNIVDPFNITLDIIKVPLYDDLDDILFDISIKEQNG